MYLSFSLLLKKSLPRGRYLKQTKGILKKVSSKVTKINGLITEVVASEESEKDDIEVDVYSLSLPTPLVAYRDNIYII